MSKFTRVNATKAVTTAWTQVALSATSVGFQELIIQALEANTWSIYVWNSAVDSTVWITLTAINSMTLTGGDLADIYIDSSVNGEGVKIFYTPSWSF